MAITTENLTFSYRDKPVIGGVSLHLEAGRFYGIMGPNGCGKTTLLDLLTGHTRPASGSVRLHGKPLAEYSKKSLAKKVALVAQNFYINFPYTAAEVVMMGRYPHIARFARPGKGDYEIVDAVMGQTGVDRFKGRYVTELSGGERQRVVFARALAQDTPILILDEATSNLDINHTLGLLSLAAEGGGRTCRTVISVFQDLNLAALYCDAMIFMKDGRVHAHGETGAVLTERNVDAVFDVTARVYHDAYSDGMRVAFKR